MPANESKTESITLSNVIRTTWKALALADQTDADELLEIVKRNLQDLEAIEAAEAAR